MAHIDGGKMEESDKNALDGTQEVSEKINLTDAENVDRISQEVPSTQPITVASSEEIKGATIVNKRKLNKKAVFVLLATLLFVGGVLAYFFAIKEDKKTDVSNTSQKTESAAPVSGNPVNYAPRFDSVASVIEYDGATWYATNSSVIKLKEGAEPVIFSNEQGLPAGSPNKLVVHDSQLWVSSLDGIAVYDKATNMFTAVTGGLTKKLQNGEIFYDSSAKKMYVNDFEGFYGYNDQTKKLDAINGPVNVRSFAANEKYVVLYSVKGPDWPIWVLNKSTGVWTKNTPALEEQSYTVFSLSGKLLVLGRSAGYTSCANVGSVTASSAYMLSESGSWQPVVAFNADKARPEVIVLANTKGSPNKVVTYACEGTKTKTYDLTLNGNELTLTNEKEVDSYGLQIDIDEQKTLISELSQATKLHAATRVLDIDGSGNVLYAYSDEYNSSSSPTYTGIALAKQNILSDAVQLDLSTVAKNTNHPVLCGTGKDRKLTYIVSGVQNITYGGMEGFPDGMWSSVKLYSVEGSKLTEIKDFGKDVSTLAFSCTEKGLVWLGNTGLNRMNLSTKNIEKLGAPVGSDLRYSNTSVSVTPGGNMWFATTSEKANSSTLYYYDVTKDAYTKLSGTANVTRLLASTDSHVVAFTTASKTQSTFVYDQAGKVAQTLQTVGYYSAPITSIGTPDEFIAVVSSTDSVITPFAYAKIKVGTPQTAPTLQNSTFTSRYTGGGESNTFGLVLYQDLVFDAARNQLWLNDDQYGVSATKLQ